MSPLVVTLLIAAAFWLGSEVGRRRSLRDLNALLGPVAPTRRELRAARKARR